MSDTLPDSPCYAKSWCPECEPWRDEMSEILIVDRCAAHCPSLTGLDDNRLGEAPLLGNNDVDSATQHGMARLLR